MKALALILLLSLLPVYLIQAQSKIEHFTFSIVDTTKSQTEQVRAIYNWITSNISYDTKQLKKGLKYYNWEETLKRKKAVCYGYSELFQEMCRAINVESYMVTGYSKGFDYVQGIDFLQANHAWNIVFADSNWMIIDATWGSGSVEYSYDIKTQIVKSIFRKARIKSKLTFVRRPTEKYFNIHSNEIIETHSPIDSKWQLSEYPTTYQGFIADSMIQTDTLDYHHEIEKIRNLKSQDQQFIDAQNSVKYNPVNKFDIGYQYYFAASDIASTADEFTNPKLIHKAKGFSDSSLIYLTEYKLLRQTFYRSRRSYLRAQYYAASKSMEMIKRIPTEKNKRLAREMSNLNSIDRKHKKTIANLEADPQSRPIIENQAIDLYSAEYDLSDRDSFLQKPIIVSLDTIEALQTRILLNCKLAEHYAQTARHHLEIAISSVLHIEDGLSNMNEHVIFSYCTILSEAMAFYSQYLDSLKNVRFRINRDYNSFNIHFNKIHGELSKMQTLFGDKLGSIPNPELDNPYETKSLMLLQNLMEANLKITEALIEDNALIRNFMYFQNMQVSLIGEKRLIQIKSRLEQYYKYVSSKYEQEHQIYMKNLSQILGSLRTNSAFINKLARQIDESF